VKKVGRPKTEDGSQKEDRERGRKGERERGRIGE